MHQYSYMAWMYRSQVVFHKSSINLAIFDHFWHKNCQKWKILIYKAQSCPIHEGSSFQIFAFIIPKFISRPNSSIIGLVAFWNNKQTTPFYVKWTDFSTKCVSLIFYIWKYPLHVNGHKIKSRSSSSSSISIFFPLSTIFHYIPIYFLK